MILIDPAISGSKAAESFALTESAEVDVLTWWGTYRDIADDPCDFADDFTLNVYLDNIGLPGTLDASYPLGANVSRIPTGAMIQDAATDFPEYRYEADLVPPLQLQAGQTYWVEVLNTSASFPCLWWWEAAPPGDASALWDGGGDGYDAGDVIDADLALCLGTPGPQFDCNSNGMEDACDIDCGTSGGPCDVPGCGQSYDCQPDGIPDECQNDENGNGIADECDIVEGGSLDINFNGVPDESECVTIVGDGDMDCDVDLLDFAVLQRCFAADGATPQGCACMDVDLDDNLDLADHAALTERLNGPTLRYASCTPRLADGCPDMWATDALAVGNTYYNFTAERILPAGFFGSYSEAFNGQVEFVGRPADPNGVKPYMDTLIEHERIVFDETTEVTVPAWISSLFLVSQDPILISYEGGIYQDEEWLVLATLSPEFPGEGSLTARLPNPTANQGAFDATIFVQPLFVFVPMGDLSGRMPPQCIQSLILDTAQAGLDPIELDFIGQPFVRVVDQSVLDAYNIAPCSQGSFVPGFTEGGARDQDPCMPHVTESEAHYFCPEECQPPSYCRYTERDTDHVEVLIGCDKGAPPTFPPSVPGPPCDNVGDCPTEFPFLVQCSGGGAASAIYESPTCYTPPPSCKGACIFDDCSCQVIEEDDCTTAGGTYQDHGSKCEDMADLDADSDDSGTIAAPGSDEREAEDMIEYDGFGPFVAVNTDDDDDDGIPDHLDTNGVVGPQGWDDDLKPIELSATCVPDHAATAKWRIYMSPGPCVNIWQHRDRTGVKIDHGTWYDWTDSRFGGQMPSTLYVEGAEPGEVKITLDVSADGGVTVAGQDKVKLNIGLIRIDKWWGYMGDLVEVRVSFFADVPDAYSLDIDIEGLVNDWDLSTNAYALVDADPTQHFFDSWGQAPLGNLERGVHSIRIVDLKAPPYPIIEYITFEFGSDELGAMFIADRPGMTDDNVAGFQFMDGHSNPLTIAGVQELLDTFAPHLYFDSSSGSQAENFFPQAIETTLDTKKCDERVVARDSEGQVVAWTVKQDGNDSKLLQLAQRYGCAGAFDTLWLDLPCDSPEEQGAGGDEVFSLYGTATLHGNTIALSYWIHYGYSNWRQHEGYNNHEGDWEGATVYLVRGGGEEPFGPSWLAYAQHEILVGIPGKGAERDGDSDGGQRADWATLQGFGCIDGNTHPRLYVGLGGHASYFSPGTDWYWLPLPYLEGHWGLHGQAPPQSSSVVVLPRAPDAVADGMAWLVFPGHWGEDDLDGPFYIGDSGPLGPVFAKPRFLGGGADRGFRWLYPVAWAEVGWSGGFDWWQPGPPGCP